MKRIAILTILALAGCGSDPVPSPYVLSAPAEPVPHAISEAGRPVLQVQRVTVPDYLDTTDMVSRDGANALKVSVTGRWGERLSAGITDALEADLRARARGFQVTGPAFSGQPARELVVNVEAFDIRPDGACVLTARWTLRGDNQTNIPGQTETFVTQAARSGNGISDGAMAAAMAAAIQQLAAKVDGALSVPSGKR
jgi:hypothetical protein